MLALMPAHTRHATTPRVAAVSRGLHTPSRTRARAVPRHGERRRGARSAGAGVGPHPTVWIQTRTRAAPTRPRLGPTTLPGQEHTGRRVRIGQQGRRTRGGRVQDTRTGLILLFLGSPARCHDRAAAGLGCRARHRASRWRHQRSVVAHRPASRASALLTRSCTRLPVLFKVCPARRGVREMNHEQKWRELAEERLLKPKPWRTKKGTRTSAYACRACVGESASVCGCVRVRVACGIVRMRERRTCPRPHSAGRAVSALLTRGDFARLQALRRRGHMPGVQRWWRRRAHAPVPGVRHGVPLRLPEATAQGCVRLQLPCVAWRAPERESERREGGARSVSGCVCALARARQVLRTRLLTCTATRNPRRRLVLPQLPHEIRRRRPACVDCLWAGRLVRGVLRGREARRIPGKVGLQGQNHRGHESLRALSRHSPPTPALPARLRHAAARMPAPRSGQRQHKVRIRRHVETARTG